MKGTGGDNEEIKQKISVSCRTCNNSFRANDLAGPASAVTQDPNDEPASKLLERIKAEKELLKKKK